MLKNWLVFDKDDGGSGGGDDPPALPPQAQDGFNGLLTRNGGDSSAVAMMLYQENYNYRNEIRRLEKELGKAQKALPTEGAVVLTDEQAQQWAAYQGLGSPDEITTERQEAQRLRRQQEISRVAEAAKFKPAVLERLAGDLPLQLREIQQDGETVNVAYVTPEGGEAKPLADYAAAEWADFLPALTAETNQQPNGVQVPRQSTGGKPVKADPVARFKERKEKAAEEQRKRNPLIQEVPNGTNIHV